MCPFHLVHCHASQPFSLCTSCEHFLHPYLFSSLSPSSKPFIFSSHPNQCNNSSSSARSFPSRHRHHPRLHPLLSLPPSFLPSSPLQRLPISDCRQATRSSAFASTPSIRGGRGRGKPSLTLPPFSVFLMSQLLSLRCCCSCCCS